jgi:hypothetical protein
MSRLTARPYPTKLIEMLSTSAETIKQRDDSRSHDLVPKVTSVGLVELAVSACPVSAVNEHTQKGSAWVGTI